MGDRERELQELGGRIARLEREPGDQAAGAKSLLAAGGDHAYRLDRSQVDLNEVIRTAGAPQARAALRRARIAVPRARRIQRAPRG